MKLNLIFATILSCAVTAQAALVSHYGFEGTGADSVGGRNLTAVGSVSYSSDTPMAPVAPLISQALQIQ